MVGSGEEDLLVFGLQEVGELRVAALMDPTSKIDLRSQALLISQGNVRAEEWETAILRALKDKASEYEKARQLQDPFCDQERKN
mgnify:CR=1 FL=1|jgi:hypothetical protein